MSAIIWSIVGGMRMSNYMESKNACRYFWESTLCSTMLAPTIADPVLLRKSLPMPVRDIVAERSDILTLKLDGDSEKTVHMYTEAWMRSLDYLLYRYLTLVLHDPHYSSTIRVPVEIRHKYQTYRNLSKKRQHKDSEFILPDYYIEPHDGALDSNDSDGKYEYFKTDNPVAPAVLNVFCHGLFPQAGDKKTRWNPHINAQLYELISCGKNTIPDFRPEDYIAYELMTGLSLSVEITAILLEIDQEIRDLALYYFCEYAIMELVRIPFPYARSTAARNYFLQINLDWNKAKYEWFHILSPDTTKQIIEDSAIKALPYILDLSQKHLGPEILPFEHSRVFYSEDADLETALQKMENDSDFKHIAEELRKAENDPTYPKQYRISSYSEELRGYQIDVSLLPHYPISFPLTNDLTEIESYKKQILKNLEVVTSPLNWNELFEPKPQNLAVFTNPKHRFVPILMDYVTTGHLQIRSQKDPPPIKSQDCIDLLQLVFSVIRSASIETHHDIYQVKRFLAQMQPPST